MSRWLSTVGWVRAWQLRRTGVVVFHRVDRITRDDDAGFRAIWRAGCGLVVSDWHDGRDHANATTYMLLEHAVKVGRPCSRCYPDGVA